MPLTAKKDGRKIAVEIKTFLGLSGITELPRALGPFVFYRFLLNRRELERTLYLALPERAFTTLFDNRDAIEMVPAMELHLTV